MLKTVPLLDRLRRPRFFARSTQPFTPGARASRFFCHKPHIERASVRVVRPPRATTHPISKSNWKTRWNDGTDATATLLPSPSLSCGRLCCVQQ